jgi:hypothetical protein
MLGSFLEFGVSARPVAEALDYYQRLGFRSLAVGDIVANPYAVVAVPGLLLGLHDRDLPGPAPTFVRPELRDHCRALRRAHVALEFSALKDDEFHRVGFLDPNELLVILVEARTFSPGSLDITDDCLCGDFLELSAHTHSREESLRFWTALGCDVLATGEAPHPWARVQSHGVRLGFHEGPRFASGLSFRCTNLAGRVAFLEAKGFAVGLGCPLSERRASGATLRAPEGTPLYLLEQAGT